MNKETYEKLSKIEDELFDIVIKNYSIKHDEITHIWSALHYYLVKINPDTLK